ncbi:MAG: thioesterase family protein [Pseudomonadota bacterium]
MSYFDTETAVIARGDIWEGHISGAWNIGDNPNGGYMLSVLLRAVGEVIEHPDPLSITAHFLRPGVPDEPCQVHVDVLKRGRMLTTVSASLVQRDKTALQVLLAMGDLGQSVGVSDQISIPAPELPAPDACVPRSGAAQGIDLPLMDRVEVRLHPDQAQAGQAGAAEISGWIRQADGAPTSALMLPLFADAFPPSPFGLLGVVGWVPTLELTVHVRRRPAPGWIKGQLKTADLAGGRMIESGALWDADDRLVAQCRQLGLVMNRSD